MKKIFLVICTFILLTMTTTFGFAQEESLDDFLNDLFGSLGPTNSQFGFAASDNITTTNKQETSIDIVVPVVKNGEETIKKYSVWGSNVSMDNYNNFDAYDADSIIDESITLTDTDLSGATATLALKGLTKDQTYYVTITPVAANGDSGVASKEISFTLGTPTTTPTNTSNPTSTPTSTDNFQGAGGPNMNLANVTREQTNTTIMMKRNALAGADKLQISYTTVGKTTMTVVGTPRMSDGKFSFKVPQLDTYIVKLQPLDDSGALVGTETNQTIHMVEGAGTTNTPTYTPGIPTVPQVGPEDYLPHVLIFSLVGYLCYGLYRKVS